MPYIKDKRLRVPFNELKKKYIHLYILWREYHRFIKQMMKNKCTNDCCLTPYVNIMAKQNISWNDDGVRFALDDDDGVLFALDDDDGVRFALDNHPNLDFTSVSSVKQQYTGRHRTTYYLDLNRVSESHLPYFRRVLFALSWIQDWHIYRNI
jgi:hypothetical protein